MFQFYSRSTLTGNLGLRILFFCFSFIYSSHAFGKFASAPEVTTTGTISVAPEGTITINGNYFTGATAVLIGNNGDIPAASFTVVSDNQIKAVLAKGTPSGWIKVITPAGASKTGLLVINVLPFPMIESFTPTSGNAGTVVTIKGYNFTNARQVNFGGTDAASYTVEGDTIIRAVVGLGSTGDIKITSYNYYVGNKSSFTYVASIPTPNIKSFTPASATIGTNITIKGNYLTGTTAVTVGGVAASSFNVVSDSVINAVVSSGAVSGAVTVTTPGGTHSLNGFIFVEPDAKPHISSFTPTSTSPRTTITIKGYNFTGATQVRIGGTPPSSFSVESDSTITAVVFSGSTGAVKVTTPGGTDSLNGFTYIPAPPEVISDKYSISVVPEGTVTINGNFFTGATAVLIGNNGDIPAASFTVISDNQLQAVLARCTPSGYIKVITPAGPSKVGTLVIEVLPVPMIESFTPTSGNAGTVVTIKGYNFTGAKVVNFGGTDAASYTVEGDTIIRAVVGLGSTGDLKITSYYSYSQSKGTFTYVASIPTPNIKSFTPASATIGTKVIIKGNYFTNATAVTLGGVAAASFTVVSDSVINAVVSSGAVSGAVTVTTPGGTHSLNGFTFVAPDVKPHISSFTPTSASPRTTITIKGYNFTGATQVRIGGTPPSSFSVESDSTITAVVFSGSTGAVKVTTPAGTDSLNGFTYIPAPPEVTSGGRVEIGPEGTLTIKGNFFTGATAVLLGNNGDLPAASFTVISDNEIQAVLAIGTVSGYVKVITPAGTSNVGSFVIWLVPAPKIYSFTPTSGNPGTVVTIKGYNFAGAKEVYFGGTNAASYTVEGDTIIRAVVGSGSTGEIRVMNGKYYFGYKGPFTYIEPATQPVITSFDPTSGTTGTIITIKGKNFTNVNGVAISGIPVLTFTVISDTVISAEVATGTRSGVVSVTTRDNLSALLAGFTYINPTPSPKINSFAPTSGTTGTVITIKGSYFTGVTAVNIGGKAAATFTVVSDSIINAVVATGAASGFVSVINAFGSPWMDGFTYVAPNLQPHISLFTPASGTVGTNVTIKGNYFTNATSVTVGGVAAASFTVVSDSVINAVVSSGAASGAVTVTTPAGTNSLNGFTFIAPDVKPYISSFTPTSGSTGTVVAIKGRNFANATTISFGGIPAASFTVVSDSVINAVVSSGAASGAVTVTTPAGTNSLNGFTFVAPDVKPYISSFTPTSGSSGTLVAIKGRNFSNATAISFGGIQAASFTVTDSVIIAEVGSGATGVVKVTTANGSDTLGTFNYTMELITAAPNPATGSVSVQHPVSANNAVIKLTNSMGNIVQNVKVIPGNSQTRLDLSGVAPGIYVIWWGDGANAFSKTVLIR